MKQTKSILMMACILFAASIYGQKSEQPLSNKAIVEKFLEGFNDPAKIHESMDLLKDDYKFTNPMVQLKSKTEFIGLAKEIGAVLTGVNVIRTTQDGEWVATYYEFTSKIPGLESNMASEWFRIENGMIAESHLIYDASKWRALYESME